MKNSKKLLSVLFISAWVAQGLLAATLLWAAATKLFKPADELAKMWPWTATNRKLVIITGILDALAALGLILPCLLGIIPQLTFYAALGLMLLMIAAIIFHVRRGEASQIGINIFIIIVAILIAWVRKP